MIKLTNDKFEISGQNAFENQESGHIPTDILWGTGEFKIFTFVSIRALYIMITAKYVLLWYLSLMIRQNQW